MERHRVVADLLTEANGRTEREAATLMADSIPGRKLASLDSGKNYDTQEFVRELRRMNITPRAARLSHSRATISNRLFGLTHFNSARE
jgi:hypothetical protein